MIGSFFQITQVDAAETVIIDIRKGTSTPGCEETNSCYSPFSVVINVDDKVVWINKDSSVHTVSSGNPADGPDGEFDSDLFMPNEQFSHYFEKPGSFSYFCLVHPWMAGEIIVQGEKTEPRPQTVTLKPEEIVNETTQSDQSVDNFDATYAVVVAIIAGIVSLSLFFVRKRTKNLSA